jgi:hypothetical protein
MVNLPIVYLCVTRKKGVVVEISNIKHQISNRHRHRHRNGDEDGNNDVDVDVDVDGDSDTYTDRY